MKQFEITIKVEVLGYDELNSDEEQLALLAREATERSYAPYSNFRVGAAIALDNGEIVSGANQENVAYPSGTCAERSACFYAHARYPQAKFRRIADAARGCWSMRCLPEGRWKCCCAARTRRIACRRWFRCCLWHLLISDRNNPRSIHVRTHRNHNRQRSYGFYVYSTYIISFGVRRVFCAIPWPSGRADIV